MLTTSSLHEHIVTCENLLEEHGEAFWRDQLSATREVDMIGNTYVNAEKLLELFHSSPSLRDVYLTRTRMHALSEDEQIHANARLSELFLQIYYLARRYIKDDVEVIHRYTGYR
ncbi:MULTISPECIES: hypothetical protein [Pseudovibrio]|uniref:hypothetical protein n=1 Tax=Stappiaceae TaxID=2821832 RepID=UPI00236624DD|nr:MULTISPECIES: hypothetical protein [Pseudovibrio]MDD7908947.1 hypothetical protein [Pseudovibrio exalbescens]MDX5593732.1 hypothetical protein [Pseudovibrio sp. SPO723]